MSFIIYNGSPRGKNSNSTVISGWFMEGCEKAEIPVRYLNKVNHHEEYAREMAEYDQILLTFPLYVDGMPGVVKNFLECLYNNKEILTGKTVTWIIHSGFEEAIHSRSLEQYLKRFSLMMGFNNHGVIIIPGSEGFRLFPTQMTDKKRLAVARLAAEFQSGKPYNEDDLSLLRGKEKMRKGDILAFKILSLFGLTNMYWNMTLKKNNALKNRFDAPYAKSPTPITTPSAISKQQ